MNSDIIVKNNRTDFDKGIISVLHVDDEKDFLTLTKRFLEVYNKDEFTIDSVYDSTQVITILKDNSYDAIVTDYQMPVIDGLVLLNQIRENHIDTPIIIFTGKGREEVAINALNLGADYYIEKGGDPKSQFSELAHIIKQVVSHKRVRKALVKSEERFRTLAELLPEAIFESDLRGKITFVNQDGMNTFGISQMDLEKGLSIFELISLKDRERVKDSFLKILDGEKLSPKEFQAVRKDGSTLPILVSAVPIRYNDEVIGIRGISFDTTRQKKIEKALTKEQDRYHTLFQETPIGILTCDTEGQITDINKTGLKILGSPSKEVTMNINVLSFPLLKSAGISGDIERCITEGKIVRTERNYTSKWGKSGCYKLDVVPVFDEHQSQVKSVLCTFSNISEMKRIESKLESEKQELSDFTHFMAHDIKNILFTISGYTELLNQENNQKAINNIRKQIIYMKNILEQSTLYATAGLTVERNEFIDLNVLVEKAAEVSIPESITFNHERLPAVKCDPERLLQALRNLFENAIIHGEPNKITVSQKIEKNYSTIIINNDGKSIPSEYKQKIFEYGFSTKTGRKGIGLAIIRKIIHAHDWSISVESTTDATEFQIDIPKAFIRDN